MKRIVLIGNEKGGCGKTTLAVSLAAMAATKGHDVLLVDADAGQRSASRWAERRKERAGAAELRCVGMSGGAMRADLSDLAKRYDVVVVDTGAGDSPELRAAATVAHVLVVPVQPDPLDLWTLPTIAAIQARARSLNPKLRCVVALNRVPHQAAASATGDVAAWIAEHIPEMSSARMVTIVGRAAYGRATGSGLCVEEAGADKAALEMTALYKEVFR